MKRKPYVAFAVGFIVCLTAATLWAHHSAAATYDTSKKITLTGKITKLEWKNPHIFYYIDVVGPNGTVNWAIEGSTPNQLYRAGWRKSDLNVGDSVTLADSSPARNGTAKAYGGKLTLADGRTVFSGSAASDQ
jgi:hypothetical protein